MARHTLPHHVIASRGVKLALDGLDVTIVYSFAGLALIEEHFDSVQGALTAISRPAHQATATAQLLACGLAHEVDAEGAPLSNVDALMPLLDTERISDYHEAIMDALAHAVPAVKTALEEQAKEAAKAAAESGEDDETDPTVGKHTSFPGASGTTSAPSPSDEPKPSSGA